MKSIRKIALTPYYPYGKNKEKILAERILNVDKALEEHDADIRADERRKFAEWLQKESIFHLDYCDWKKCVRVVDEETPNYKISHTESRNATLNEVLAEYEKEQKNE